MSANVYHCATVAGPVLMRRATKQGRRPQPAELVKVKMAFRAARYTKERVLSEAAKHSMTPSAYMDLVLALADIEQLLSDENCSIQ